MNKKKNKARSKQVYYSPLFKLLLSISHDPFFQCGVISVYGLVQQKEEEEKEKEKRKL